MDNEALEPTIKSSTSSATPNSAAESETTTTAAASVVETRTTIAAATASAAESKNETTATNNNSNTSGSISSSSSNNIVIPASATNGIKESNSNLSTTTTAASVAAATTVEGITSTIVVTGGTPPLSSLANKLKDNTPPYDAPPPTPISKVLNITGTPIVRKEKRQTSARYNASKNCELTALIPLNESGRACAVLLEQRVHYVADIGQLGVDITHHVPSAQSQLKDALEQDHPRSDLQCTQAVHGDESAAFRRVQQELQAREADIRGERNKDKPLLRREIGPALGQRNRQGAQRAQADG
ncbi:GM15281 [Drosophila sechellia]|uniref:GM15281 n=1 Tax=Drosophila sechellia TaxID=7238 RepID=B4IBA1_DROSE|nr:GM15281 [Drosophila sechellia]